MALIQQNLVLGTRHRLPVPAAEQGHRTSPAHSSKRGINDGKAGGVEPGCLVFVEAQPQQLKPVQKVNRY